jgi:hypothetical protein
MKPTNIVKESEKTLDVTVETKELDITSEIQELDVTQEESELQLHTEYTLEEFLKYTGLTLK